MRRFPRLAGLLAPVVLGGCMVVRTWRGEPGVDASILVPGASRAAVEERVGAPVRTWRSDRGVEFGSYRMDGGIEGSVGDACAWAFLDVASAFLTELFALVSPHPCMGPRIAHRFVASWNADGALLGVFDEYAVLPDDGRVPAGAEPWTPTRAPAAIEPDRSDR